MVLMRLAPLPLFLGTRRGPGVPLSVYLQSPFFPSLSEPSLLRTLVTGLRVLSTGWLHLKILGELCLLREQTNHGGASLQSQPLGGGGGRTRS